MKYAQNQQVIYVLASAICVTLIVLVLAAPFWIFPAEDAAILFHISSNFAKFGIISYNIADGRAEGATDFLWMLLIAGQARLGISEFVAANLLSAVALLATVAVIARLSGPRRDLSVLACVVGLAIAPMLPAALIGFSNLFFGCFALAVAVLAVSRMPWAFYLVGLLCCLVRPDGVLFVAGACACRWLAMSRLVGTDLTLKARWKDEFAPGLTALALGVGYFAWRWTYFDEFLPLPLLVKSSCEVRLLGFCRGGGILRTIAYYGLFATAAFCFFLARSKKECWPLGVSLFCSLCAVPLTAYGFLNLQQNIADRFFYPAFLGAVTLVALGLGTERPFTQPARAAGLAVMLLLPWILSPVGHYWKQEVIEKSSIVPIALALRQVQPPGRLGSTEAGLLPYLSGWSTVDLWGLNTRRYAHRLFSSEDLKRENFDLVVVHAGQGMYDSYLDIHNYCGHQAETARSWFGMIANIYAGICSAGGPARYEPLFMPHLIENAGMAAGRHGAAMSTGAEVRYIAYFLRREFAGYGEVRDILLRHGALDFMAYAELRRRLSASASIGDRGPMTLPEPSASR
jgi:hypothetical protein